MSIQYIDQNADLVGTVAETFNIDASNDKLQFTIDGGIVQNFTLTHGATRTAAQIATELNATLVGATAYTPATGPQAGHVRIRTTSANGASSTILVGNPSNNANATLGFSATTYAGAVRQHVIFASPAGTKQELINEIETVLLAAGWTTVSGSGTTNLLMQSCLSPPGQDLQMRLRVKDNSGNCVTLSIENVAGTKASTNSTTAGFMLLPAASKTWLFTVNKYQGFVRTPITTAAREFAAFGIPSLPTFLQGVVTEAIWGGGNAENDTSTSVRYSMRTTTGWTGNLSNIGNQAAITNGNLWENNNSTANAGKAGLIVALASSLYPNSAGISGYSWHDDSALLIDALIAWGLTTASTVAKFRGMVWDAVLSSESYTGDLTTNFDSHNWIVLTDTNAGLATGYPRGTVLLVTP